MLAIALGRKVIHPPFRPTYFILHSILLFLIMFWLIGLYGLVFGLAIGLPAYVILLIFIFSLLGSNVNIPLFYMKSYRPIVTAKVVRIFFWDFIVPEVDWSEQKTLISVNVGGCIIPVALSLYLLYIMVFSLGIYVIALWLIALIINSLLIYSVSRPIEGIGIVTPALLPPLFTVIVSEFFIILIPSKFIFAFIYSLGTMGSLIGADLLNIKKIPNLGAPMASIGGAGIFDGVFLNGLFAVLLALF